MNWTVNMLPYSIWLIGAAFGAAVSNLVSDQPLPLWFKCLAMSADLIGLPLFIVGVRRLKKLAKESK